MKTFIATLLLLASCVLSQISMAAVVRFDEHYFFQSEQLMQERGVKFDVLARYSTKLQQQVWQALKKGKIPATNGYLVVAFRADGQVATWLDMQPALHAYYAYQVTQALKKIPPPPINAGTIVFGVKMAVETEVHTKKTVPAPTEWQDARASLPASADIESVVAAAWPE